MGEVGADAVRWFFSSRAFTSGIDFDLELAKRQSNENPVYYVQYAHARASSILRHAAEGGIVAPDDGRTGELLTHPAEQALIRHLLDFPDTVAIAAERRETHEVPRYAYELARAFCAFYRDCKVLTEDADLSAARLALVDATRSVLANALGPAGDLARPSRCSPTQSSAASCGAPQELVARGVRHQHISAGELDDGGREGRASRRCRDRPRRTRRRRPGCPRRGARRPRRRRRVR